MHHRNLRGSYGDHDYSKELQEQDYKELESHLRVIDQHRDEAGRSGDFEIVVGMGSDYDSIRRCEQMGATVCTVGPDPSGLRGTKDDFSDWIMRFSDEVISRL